jgi:hypothetical protein
VFSGRCWRFVECCGDDAVQDDQESPLPSCEVVTLSGPPRKRVYGLRSCVQPPEGASKTNPPPASTCHCCAWFVESSASVNGLRALFSLPNTSASARR